MDLPKRPIQKQAPLIRELCKVLMREELNELQAAMEEDDLVEVADGITDLLYVTLYTANAYGLSVQPFWDEVQRSNMTKAGGAKRSDGKQLKGDQYSPPDIKSILEEQGAELP